MNRWIGANIASAALRPPTSRATATAIASLSLRTFSRIRLASTSHRWGRRQSWLENEPERRPAAGPLPDIPPDFFPGYHPCLANFGKKKKVLVLARKSPKEKPYELLGTGLKMHSYVKVANTPTADCPGTVLLLHFDNKRYLFGQIADGSQRMGVQRGMYLHKVTDIFLTGPIRAQNTGGLFGMILTIADVHASARNDIANQNKARQIKGQKLIQQDKVPLKIHGGKNLAHMLASGRAFVFRNNFPVQPYEIFADPRSGDPSSSEPDFADELIRVWNVPLYRSGTPGCDSENPRKRRRIEAPVIQEGDTPESEQQLRESVVRAMFSSDWKLDRLTERWLSQVRLPAKVFIRDDDGKIQNYEGPLPGQPGFTDRTVLTREPWPADRVTTLPSTTPAQDSLCYIVKEQPRRGKFLAQEAKKLGVPPRRNGELTMGKTVTLEDGTVVRPDQVMEAAPTPVGFAILDVCDPALLDSLVNRPEWSNAEVMDGIQSIYWILSDSVKTDPRLTQLMRGFGDKVEHILFGENISRNELAFTHAAIAMTNRNRIDPDRFHLPLYSLETPQIPPTMPKSARIARVNEKFQLAPTTGLDTADVVQPLDPRKIAGHHFTGLRKADDVKAVISLARQASKKVKDPKFIAMVEESEKDTPQRDTEIIPLGTGSCLPSLHRNVSSTLLRVPGYGTCLLDCGENTLGQMLRMYGPEETDQILRDMRFIYLSHLHADHHLGTNTVLERLAKARGPDAAPLVIICPLRLATALRDSMQLENLGRIQFITRKAQPYPVPHEKVQWDYSEGNLFDTVGLRQLDAVFVDHCLDAMAVAITFPSGLKIAYSGDCRPSVKFAQIGRDAHLLIHECTFDDDRQGDAMAKKHSTFSEAVRVAKWMGAKRLLLTHFSQRYPKIQNLTEVADDDGETAPVTVFAFDQMRLRLGDFQYAAEYLPAIRALVNQEEDDKEVGCEGGAERCDDANGNGNGQQGKKNKKNGKQQQGKEEQQQQRSRSRSPAKEFRKDWDI